jgi:predicted PurR-regulated permease PerM
MDLRDRLADGARSPLVPLLMIAAIAVVLSYAEAVHGLLATLTFSALAGVLCRAFQLWLQGRGLGRGAAVTLTVAAFIVVLALLGIAGVAAVLAVVVQLSGEAERLQSELGSLAATFASATGLPSDAVPTVDTSAVIGAIRQLLGIVGPAVTSLGMSVIIVTYLLLDAERLRSRMLRHTPPGTVARYDALAGELVVYIKVRAILGAAAAVADTILLLILGVPYAVLWGVLSFLFSFVPNIGFILALVPPTLFAFLEFGLGPAVAVVVGYVVINLAFDYVLQPRILSVNLDISPVVVIVSILFWTVVIGPAGALLAVPLTITLRVLLLPFENARWFVALLGPVPGDHEAPAPTDPTIATVPDPVASTPTS